MKSPGTIIATIALGVALVGNVASITTAHQASNVADANKTVFCQQADALEKQNADAEKYLSQTPAERMKEYGPALGSIPENIVQRGIDSRNAQLVPLHKVDC